MTNDYSSAMTKDNSSASTKWLFWTCFVSLTATSFGFISRVFLLDAWAVLFNFSETQKGEIFGAGLWPFAISIVLFSLVIDWFGYRKAMFFATTLHITSAIMTIFATGYTSLYWAAFVGALANGTIEAVINPVIATVYSKEKTKWLNILHAGWPVGLLVAGALTILLGTDSTWKFKASLMLIPVIAYGIMLLRCQFPVNERVAAKVPYRKMLREPGGFGMFIVVVLIVCELGRVIAAGQGIDTPWTTLIIASILASVCYGLYFKSLGRPLYVLMLLVMLLLATTELGTDGWIKDLMGPVFKEIGIDAGWILVYTATIMAVLRFMTGPILRVTRLSPLGLLSMSCVLVIAGLVTLSQVGSSAGLVIVLLAATIYGAGQCFFWPTTLGYIAEQFPRGGALTLNAIAGVGMLGVGVLGGPWLGYVQNTEIQAKIESASPAIYAQIQDVEKESHFGTYIPIDRDKEKALSSADSALVTDARNEAKSVALLKVTVLPFIMLLVYLALILYHKSKGGYRPEVISSKDSS